MTALLRAPGLGLACGALVACNPIDDPCFSPPSTVRDVRILAVAADPPEARFDPSTGLADPVTLRALVVEPSREAPASRIRWELCPATADSPGCPPGSEVAADPAWGPGSSARVQVSPQLIERSIAADPLHGLRDVRVRAVIHVEGARPEAASALIFFSSGPAPLNTAPVIAAVRTARVGQPLQDLPPDHFLLSLSVAQANAIRPVPRSGSLEEYDSVDLSGTTVRLRERITYSFYANDSLALGRGLVLKQGAIPVVIYRGLDDFEADEPDPGTPDGPQGLFVAVPVRAGGGSGTVWIVARDSRGAASWVSIPYVAADERGCGGASPGGGPTPVDSRCPQLQFGCF